MSTDTTDQQGELLPCPFCGSPGEILESSGADNWIAQCSNYMCGVKPRTSWWPSREKVVVLWNVERAVERRRQMELVAELKRKGRVLRDRGCTGDYLTAAAYEESADQLEALITGDTT